MSNSSSDPSYSGGLFGNGIGSFGYGIGISLGILLLITTITLTSYYCINRSQDPQNPSNRRRRTRLTAVSEPESVVIEVGLDEEVINTYPTVLYSEAKISSKNSDENCCSICLADYKSSDKLRMLPDCNHLFHLKCIDPWLRLHPTCPLCRTSPLPTPLSTPLAEVVPLASRRDG